MKEEVKESKEVATKAQNAVAISGTAEDMNAWAAPELTAQDVVIPRILIMQPTSKILLEGQGLQLGDVVESLTKSKLSGKDEPLEFVPFFQTKVWVEYDVTEGEDIKNKKFLRITPVTPANENLPYKDEEKTLEGKMIKVMRDRWFLRQNHTRSFFSLSFKSFFASSFAAVTKVFTLNHSLCSQNCKDRFMAVRKANSFHVF